jgi:nucleolar GTP-binding protein
MTRRKDEDEGKNIPTVLDADEVIDKAFRKASKVRIEDPEPFYAFRKTLVAKLDSVSDTIGATLDRYISAFPSFNNLSPFHHELYGVLFEITKAQRSLAALLWAKGQVAAIARKNASQMAKSKSRDFLDMKLGEAYGRINSVIQQVGKNLVFLAGVREEIKKVPCVSMDVPTVIVAGAPNVGKSLLVRKISTGKPEVAPYPFTTKAISVGHFDYKKIRFQVLDTPGLLDRPLSKRNKIELQAIMALRHLAGAIIFIMDPTEECGTELGVQNKLLEEIERDFIQSKGSKVFIAYNKTDLKERWKGKVPDGSFPISAETGDGVEPLKEAAAKYLFKKIISSGRLF